MATLVREAKYIKSDVRKNNNKFWYIYQYDDNTIETHWGRVGDDGQRKTKPFPSEHAASSFFDRKCKEKSSFSCWISVQQAQKGQKITSKTANRRPFDVCKNVLHYFHIKIDL